MYIDASRFLVHEGGHRVVVNLDFSRKVRSEKVKLYYRGSLILAFEEPLHLRQFETIDLKSVWGQCGGSYARYPRDEGGIRKRTKFAYFDPVSHSEVSLIKVDVVIDAKKSAALAPSHHDDCVHFPGFHNRGAF